jgi:transcriptional adapter 2-alpha
VTCFSEGKSTKNHNPSSHAYRVIEQHSIPVYTDDWGADEELLLLEGAETYGLGSWAEIADHIGGCRTKEEVRDHYIKTYVQSSTFPLPKHASPNDRALIDEIPREEFQARKKQRIEQRKDEIKNAQPAPPKQKPTASVPSCHEVAGYMPGRLEFETEYFNDAEEAVQHMQFEPGDGQKTPADGDAELELKMTIMEIYNNKLVSRVERKKIIFEHQLLDYKRHTAAEKKRNKEERELMNRAKPFARMMNHADFITFCDDIEYEHNLRQAITQLQDWRIHQISDLKSGEKYEQEKQQRQQRPPPSAFSGLDRLPRASAKGAIINDGPSIASQLVSHDLSLKPYATPPASEVDGPISNGITNGISNGLSNGVNGTSHTQPKVEKFVLQPLPNTSPLDFEKQPADKQPVPDLHLLSDEEREICRILRIYPKPYIVLKETVLKEVIKLGGSMKKKTMRDLCKIDSTKASRLFDFWVHCGWISKG